MLCKSQRTCKTDANLQKYTDCASSFQFLRYISNLYYSGRFSILRSFWEKINRPALVRTVQNGTLKTFSNLNRKVTMVVKMLHNVESGKICLLPLVLLVCFQRSIIPWAWKLGLPLTCGQLFLLWCYSLYTVSLQTWIYAFKIFQTPRKYIMYHAIQSCLHCLPAFWRMCSLFSINTRGQSVGKFMV